MPNHTPTRTRSVMEAIEWLGISRRKFYDEIAAGRITTFKIGRRRLVSERALDEYVRRLEKEGAA